MAETPSYQTNADSTKREANKDILPIGGPPTAAIPPPPAPKNNNPAKKRRWTNDPGMFWVTVAGVVAVVAYTTVAKWQLDESKLQRISSQRAFMTVKGIEFQTIPFLGTKGMLWLGNSVLENSGNTPTSIYAFTYCVQSFYPAADPAKMEKPAVRTSDLRRLVFGPKQIAYGGLCPVSALNAIFSMLPTGIHLYVYGSLIYDDIFKSRTHITDFCLDNVAFALGGTTAEPTMSAFTSSCRAHNCVDEECSEQENQRWANFMGRKVKFYRIPSLKQQMRRSLEAAKGSAPQ